MFAENKLQSNKHFFYYQTILTCGNDGYHIGYFRDCPSEAPVFVASMSDVKPGLVSPLGDNVFDALRVYCKEAEKKVDTFKKPAFSKLISQLEDAAKTHGFKLDSKTDAVRQRKKKVVCRSFHGAGIVVPYDKETDVGYREIPETDANLRKMLQRVSDAKNPAARSAAFATVQEVITNSQWATDEGDFGMGLELGMDLFLFGCPHLHSSAKHLMTVAYDLLGRQEFSTILKAHLKNRRKGQNLSAFN
ncbi:hypothetical protein HAZT_HAZT000884 [Hyalella azteca]|uniref:Uncharacterized protein n=1 Tax=Hyalella azteca TaxID=294128 RepID=A0A6A0GX43_HYAAZ|nr:hypothetical protein HAZT_HAZT000884 [Hyalella azteca]